ncbi:MAG: glycosyltransferase [Bacilli bacterium]|nr:glycosyltransferase [Bacilli bacterium]
MKKKLLFTSYSLDLGGIEKALVNLLNIINYDKYEVTLVLEKKEGIFLDEINPNVKVEELKVSNIHNTLIRKAINFTRKFLFKLKYHNKYDFSCCYATYSYSSAKIAQIASTNSSIFIHGNYNDMYPNKDEFYEFFNSRNISNFRKIIFVSNESKDAFSTRYPELKDKFLVLNNFIDTDEIITKSKEEIDIEKPTGTLLVFIGRLDDQSKKVFRQINLVKNIPDINLWIIGEGPDRSKYEDKVQEEKLTSRIKFLGQKKNPYPYMNKADYIILTSDYEGFPVTYLEAITLNKDIITTIPTSDDLIDIRNYGHVISKDEDKMIEEVKDIIKSKSTVEKIDFNKKQKERIKQLEELFDEVI